MANYKILIKPSAVNELNKLSKNTLKKITEKIQNLSNDPRPAGCQTLSLRAFYRIRQGNYRIVYSVEDETKIVRIVKVGHRREIYR